MVFSLLPASILFIIDVISIAKRCSVNRNYHMQGFFLFTKLRSEDSFIC